jgi:hypothetical protein
MGRVRFCEPFGAERAGAECVDMGLKTWHLGWFSRVWWVLKEGFISIFLEI